MRAISLWQPWASLVAIGAKRNETRHWSTRYRGWIAIHAAKRYPPLVGPSAHQAMCEAFGMQGFALLPRGGFVAVAKLVACIPTAEIDADPAVSIASARERLFGDYGPDRFVWVFGKVIPLVTMLPALGRQSFWTPSDVVRATIIEHLTEPMPA